MRKAVAVAFIMLLALAAAAQVPEPTPDQAASYEAQGLERFKEEKYEEAIALFRKAMPLYRKFGRQASFAYCLYNVAAAQQNLRSYKDSIATYKQVLPLLTKLSLSGDEAVALLNIGREYKELGNKGEALKYLLQAIPKLKALDRSIDEAPAAFDAGSLYYDREEFKKAAEYYDRALVLYQKLKDARNVAAALSNLGLVYARLDNEPLASDYVRLALDVLGDIKEPTFECHMYLILGRARLRSGYSLEALASYQQALDKSREAADRLSEANALAGMGSSLSELGRYDEALQAHQDSLKIYAELKDEGGQISELGDIALAYNEQGKYGESFEYNDRALELARRSKNKAAEQTMVNNIGIAYLRLGSFNKAAEYIERAARIGRELNDERNLALLTTNLGAVYTRLKQHDKAIAYFERSLPTLRKFNEFKFIVIGNYYHGMIRRERGELDKAITLHTESIEVAKFAHTPKFEARARVELGLDLLAKNELTGATDEFRSALITAREVSARDEESAALDGLMQSNQRLGRMDLAIFYGKQSVNLLQATRGEIGAAEKDIQINYVKDNEQTYRRLAEALISAGRLPEAQQVLAMLKEEELSGFVRRDAKEIEGLSKRSELRSSERSALERYNLLAGKVASLGAELARLEDERRRTPADQPFARQARFDQLSLDVKDANTAFRIFLDKELAAELGSEKKKEVEADRALQGKLRQWGDGTVALATIVGQDRYRVILTTPEVQVDGKAEITAANLNHKIFAFRQALLHPSVDPRPAGKELYDILIKPVEGELAAAGAKTLLWSLDGTLRYIPLNALWDGKQYLVEKYRNVIVTSTTRQSLQSAVDTDWRVLGGGVTKASKVTGPDTAQAFSFDELKGVAGELSSIVADPADPAAGALPGVKLLDAAFTQDALKQQLGQFAGTSRKYNVVHFATHFRLGSDTSDSFLLLGNNSLLSLAEIADTPAIDLTDVELVTLSACNTGFGGIESKKALEQNNGKEVDSLAQFIEMRGAKSVMATLWPVVDESTARLMGEFYRIKKDAPEMSKAEALRLAQTALLTGQLKVDVSKQKGKRSDAIALDDEAANMPKFIIDPAKPFAHPHYWASFVLIGNWR